MAQDSFYVPFEGINTSCDNTFMRMKKSYGSSATQKDFWQGAVFLFMEKVEQIRRCGNYS